MKILKVSTKEPKQLRDDIIQKIIDKKIRTWDFKNDELFHTGQQYLGHFHFKFNIDDNKGLLVFEFSSKNTSDFANTKAFHLLENMLEKHFEDRIEIIK